MNQKRAETLQPTRSIRSSALLLGLILGFSAHLRAEETTQVVDADTSPYHVALLNYQGGHYDAALTAINAAEQAKPGDLPIEILKSRILTEQHDFAAGEKLLRHLLTPDGPIEIQLALGDLLLRKRDFDGASKYYDLALQKTPDDPDIILKMVYSRVGGADLIAASKYASKLRPLDPDHPCYYFAKAALAQATDKEEDAEQDIETVRTIYGITVTNRYLKLYLEIFAAGNQRNSSALTPGPSTNTAPATPKP